MKTVSGGAALSRGSGSGRDSMVSDIAIPDVLGLQCLPSLFESVRNLYVTLAFRETLHRGRHGHMVGWGCCPCSQIYSGIGSGRGGRQGGEWFR